MPSIDFYYDFISPYSYLATIRLPELTQKHPYLSIDWIPVNLPSIIRRSGNIPPATVPSKARYLLRDLKRWAEYFDVPLKIIKPGTFDARPALNIASALSPEERKTFSQTLFQAIWSGKVDINEPDWLQRIFDQHHLPLAWLALAGEKTSPALERQTQQALQEGIFGAPTFILRGEKRSQMFWGVDRMDFLERAILQSS
ncbi:MAG: hypothetical protein AXA67_04755 [Methylothermaceae bacteria B42]|nr:MAG: hypothetical protein AXA67_04755 [Methylothermaceae bacteria B42]HHJ39997.1 2-hydroxychromene-2-carboxylate isomerase [Methylothermaceae bacterium]